MASLAALSNSFGGVDALELMSELTYERSAGLCPRVDAALNMARRS
jgi:hypothetical protein